MIDIQQGLKNQDTGHLEDTDGASRFIVLNWVQKNLKYMDFTQIYTDFIQNFEIRGLQVDFMQILLTFTIQGFF